MSVEDTSKLSVLKHRPFAQFWLSRVMGSLANQMQTIAVSWQVYELTGSPFDLGLVGLAQFLPLVALMLVAGHVADRYDRKLVVCISQIVDGVAMGILALGTAGGWLTRDVILAIVVMFGAARVFQQPTQQSLLPLIVPPALLSRAVAASSSSNQIATIIGPAIGGLLLAVSIPLVYMICCTFYFIAAVLTLLIKVEQQNAKSREPITFRSFFAGIGFIRRQPIILGSITLDLFAVVLGGATALLPIYAKDIFETGPDGLGWLRVSPAIGALAVSFAITWFPIRRHAGPIMFATVAFFGVGTIVFGLSTSQYVAMAALVVMGASDFVSVVIRLTLIQLGTPNEMRGRVSAVNYLFVGTSNQLGDFRSGLTAEWLGVVPSVLIGGIGTLAVVAASVLLFPQLRRIDCMEDVRKETEKIPA